MYISNTYLLIVGTLALTTLTFCALYAQSFITVGMHAPDFALFDQNGALHTLSKELEQAEYVILLFYPADNSPGCTKQLCSMRDIYPTLPASVKLFGISTDSVQSHTQFAQEHRFPFPILSDVQKSVRKAYGASRLGFPSRVTFIINRKGIVIERYDSLWKVGHHVDRVISFIQRLKQSSNS